MQTLTNWLRRAPTEHKTIASRFSGKELIVTGDIHKTFTNASNPIFLNSEPSAISNSITKDVLRMCQSTNIQGVIINLPNKQEDMNDHEYLGRKVIA